MREHTLWDGPDRKYLLLKDERTCAGIIKDRYFMWDRDMRRCESYRAVPKGSLVLDVGAFIGYTTALMVDDGFKVWGFEPWPDAYLCAVYNVPEARIIHAAVGNSSKASLRTDEDPENCGTRKVIIGQESDLLMVRLDDLYYPDRVRFIKMDTEGCECAVIEGARKLIVRDRPAMFIEVYPDFMAKHGFDKDRLYDLLKDLGYEWRVASGREDTAMWNIEATPKKK